MPTRDVHVPVKGTAGYLTHVSGVIVDKTIANPLRFLGAGGLYLDFPGGRISGYVPLEYQEIASYSGMTREHRIGSWRYDGALTANANGFSGTVTMDGFGAYSGSGTGQLFGPQGQEIGGVFHASHGDTGSASGYFIGVKRRDITDPAAPVSALAELPQATVLHSVVRNFNAREVATVSYNPADSSYRVRMGGDSVRDLVLNAASLDPTRSTPGEDVFYNTIKFTNHDLENRITAHVIKPGVDQQGITLTYASLIFMMQDSGGEDGYRRVFGFNSMVSGLQTPIAPRSGSATYSAITGGFAKYSDPKTADAIYKVNGTANFDVNFASQNITANLGKFSGSLVPQSDNGSALQTREFAGASTTARIDGSTFASAYSYSGASLSGSFFGPDAAEIGGTFQITPELGVSNIPTVSITGGFVGVKD